MRAPRVLLVAASPAIIGGHSVQAAQIEGCLRASGVEVETLAIDRPMPAWLRRIRGVRTAVNEGLYAAALHRVRQADVVHVFSASYWSFLLAPVPAMLAGRMAGRRVVLHYHSGEVADHLERWGWRVHPWLRLADDIVVCSEFQRAVFQRHGHGTRVIPNVVDLDRFAFRDRDPLAPRFICTRNLERHYGVDVVLEAFAWIRARHPGATLVMAGDGSQMAALQARAARLGTKGARFVGAVPPAGMPGWLARSDVYLNASVVDNQPVSIIEAMASGLPVVSTPVGGIPEMIEDGRSGRLVPVDDPRAMADAALDLLARPTYARALAREARARAARHAWDAVHPAWEEVYGLPVRAAERARIARAGTPASSPGAHA
jgi:glycosyltransferase involved in cell wall biosynthesis